MSIENTRLTRDQARIVFEILRMTHGGFDRDILKKAAEFAHENLKFTPKPTPDSIRRELSAILWARTDGRSHHDTQCRQRDDELLASACGLAREEFLARLNNPAAYQLAGKKLFPNRDTKVYVTDQGISAALLNQVPVSLKTALQHVSYQIFHDVSVKDAFIPAGWTYQHFFQISAVFTFRFKKESSDLFLHYQRDKMDVIPFQFEKVTGCSLLWAGSFRHGNTGDPNVADNWLTHAQDFQAEPENFSNVLMNILKYKINISRSKFRPILTPLAVVTRDRRPEGKKTVYTQYVFKVLLEETYARGIDRETEKIDRKNLNTWGIETVEPISLSQCKVAPLMEDLSYCSSSGELNIMDILVARLLRQPKKQDDSNIILQYGGGVEAILVSPFAMV